MMVLMTFIYEFKTVSSNKNIKSAMRRNTHIAQRIKVVTCTFSRLLYASGMTVQRLRDI